LEALMSRARDEAEGLRHVSWLGAMLFRVFGPADTPHGPLEGTRYDPLYRQVHQREVARQRRERIAERQAED
jgi:hypothetical protein